MAATPLSRNDRISFNLRTESGDQKAYYLAGPMSGLPSCNFPAFFSAATDLRASFGAKIISPAELDDPAIAMQAMSSPDGSLPAGETWGNFLSRDVKIVADEVQGIVLLPGWEKSRGARLEAYVGVLCGHEFWLYPRMERVNGSYIVARL